MATYRLGLQKVTSYGILSRLVANQYSGTFEELQKVYQGVLRHNLLLGWWGIPAGLYWTPVVLIRNRKAFRKIKALEETSQSTTSGGLTDTPPPSS